MSRAGARLRDVACYVSTADWFLFIGFLRYSEASPSGSDRTRMLKSKERMPPETTPPKVGFVSLGCPKNLVDSEVMMGLLQSGGAQITSRAEDADIIVVN